MTDAAPARPNVLVVLLDDMGFAQLGCFGSDIATPHIDRLAAGGLRYSRFHVTALCSPTRASLLTGRNHHAVGMGFVPEVPMDFPGYSAHIPRSAATVARLLRDDGYNTFAVGKWHLTPRWEISASGPFDRWPTGLGFEHFYGFLGADTNQWAPDLLARDTQLIDPPTDAHDAYHLTEDLADQAIRYVRDQQQATPHRPFFLYFAPGAMHAPHHVADEWIAPYVGTFDDGWEAWRDRVFARQVADGVVPPGTECSARPDWVPAWDTLPEEERRLYARQMEIFAGFLTHTDAQIGRILDTLDDLGVLDDTLVLLCSDNGASAEGGPVGSVNENAFAHGITETPADVLPHRDELGGFHAYNHYAWGWAWAGNCPLRLWKRYTWLGGTRTPLIAHWPRGIADPGATRDQFCHVIDLMPTILDVAGVAVPATVDGIAQQPVDGASLRSTFAAADAPAPRTRQYFEMFGSRAMYDAPWMAVTDHVGDQMPIERERIAGSTDFPTDRWLLFDLDTDFAEVRDRADAHPDVAARLAALWDDAAEANGVYPLDDSMLARLSSLSASPNPPRHRYVFDAHSRVAEDACPPMGGDFTLAVDLEVAGAGEGDAADGVLCAQGNWTSGWALYLHGGVPTFAYNHRGIESHVVRADAPVPAGRSTVRLDVTRAGEVARLAWTVAGTAAGTGEIPRSFPFRWQIGGSILRIGYDVGLPVTDEYTVPSRFPGTIHAVTFEIPSLAPPDPAHVVETARRGD